VQALRTKIANGTIEEIVVVGVDKVVVEGLI